MRGLPLLAACSDKGQKSPADQLDYIASITLNAVEDIADALDEGDPAPRRNYTDGTVSRFKNKAREWAISRECTADEKKKGMTGTECFDYISNAEISFASANDNSGVVTASHYTAQAREGRFENIHIVSSSGPQPHMTVREQHCFPEKGGKDGKGGNDIHCEGNNSAVIETTRKNCTINGKSVSPAQFCREIINNFAASIREIVLAED